MQEAPRHPVDHGYSWVICLGAFGVFFLTNGTVRSVGILFVEIVDLFDSDKGLAALIMALISGGYALFAAVGNTLGMMTSMRQSALIGSVSMLCGMLFTSVAPNIAVVILSLGLLYGAGSGLMQGPSMVSVGQYFEKRRALASGIAIAGGSIGTLVIPQFLNVVIERYGFRGAMLLYAGLMLHAIPSAMLLRPVSFYASRRPADKPAQEPSEYVAVPNMDDEDCDAASSESSTSKTKVEIHSNAETAAYTDEPPVSRRTAAAADSDDDSFGTDEGSSSELVADRDDLGKRQRPAVRTVSDDAASTTSGCGRLCNGLRAFGRNLCDRDLLHSVPFILYTLGITIGQGGYFDACFFLPPYAVEKWSDKRFASLLITVVGLSDLVGRILGGWFADLGLVRKPFIMGFSFLVVGALTVCLPLLPAISGLAVVYVVVLGLLGGTYQALIVVVIADLFGVAKLAPGVGLSMLVMGIAILPLPPFLGKTQEWTGSFASSLIISGALMVLAGILFYLIPLAHRRQKYIGSTRRIVLFHN